MSLLDVVTDAPCQLVVVEQQVERDQHHQGPTVVHDQRLDIQVVVDPDELLLV